MPRPVYGHGLVFICTGFQEPSLLAVRPDGRGDVTKSKIVWRLDRGMPCTPSPLLVGDELYFVTDNGIATCVDAKTGEELWRARLDGNYSASPIYADGRIYFLSEEGESIVIAPGRELKHLATNQLEARPSRRWPSPTAPSSSAAPPTSTASAIDAATDAATSHP